MPSKDRDDDVEERPSERRQQTKHDRDPNRPHKSSRPSRPKIIDPLTGETIRSPRRRDKEKYIASPMEEDPSELVPELSRTASAPGASSRSSLPYPSFSKAHSKEAVNSRDDVRSASAPKINPYTPDTTDLGSDGPPRMKSFDNMRSARDSPLRKDERPPSPPDTEFSQQRKSTATRVSQMKEEDAVPSRSNSQASQRSWFGKLRTDEEESKISTKSKGSKASTAVRSKPKARVQPIEIVDDDSQLSAESESAVDSNATSIAPQQPTIPPPPPPMVRPPALEEDDSPGSAHDSSPRTPTAATPQFPHDFKPAPSPFVTFDIPDAASDIHESPMPPPPPPPPMVPINIPRVDYLMQNGGLVRPVPRSLLAITPAFASQPQYVSKTPTPADVEKVFTPFYSLLDQYETVLTKNGSVAVATGYKSVARRLLDRLENVFARDLSSEGCFCVVCLEDERHDEHGKGLSWGDVLEWVSGRRELPAWPPWDFASMKQQSTTGLGLSGHQRNGSSGRPSSPVKIDPDIDEQFHQHYLKQSKKTKTTVDRWLSSQPGAASAAPPDIDDETLSFTIVTHLDEFDRSMFNALMAGLDQPAPSMPQNAGTIRPELITKTGLSLQRLYRLPLPPRDPEIAIYLVKNPELHNLLATLSGIHQSEWEILISGRFDGFLWSGADSEMPGSILNSPAASRGPTPAQAAASRGTTPAMGLPLRGPTPAGRHPSFSRMTTPFSGIGLNRNAFSPVAGYPTRGPTPMAPTSMPPTPLHGGRPAVSNDEDAEIAVLAEVEREIYTGMEALEDAFEALHRKAEVVRTALRQRGAGLSMMAQSRHTAVLGGVGASGLDGTNLFARLGTPGFGERQAWEYADSEVDVESEWGGDDGVSELAPDDSASNISSSRRRRPLRRKERSTPAPVEEEDEEEAERTGGKEKERERDRKGYARDGEGGRR